MGNIRRPSKSVIGGSETGSFFQFVNGREPKTHEFWCHGIYGICCEMHHYSRIVTPDGTVGEFVTENISENGRRNKIIGELFINGSVQFIGISEIWGRGLSFIPNPRVTYCFRGWCSTGAASFNGNPCSITFTGIWGGIFSTSNLNWIGNWNGSVSTNPTDFPWSQFFPCITQRRVRKYFFQRIQLHYLVIL